MVLFDDDLALLYGRALVAIARADGDIDADEGRRLQEVLDARARRPVSLEDLLFEPPFSIEQLLDLLDRGPFRGSGVHVLDIGKLLVADAIAVSFARDGITSGEEHLLLRYATALGVSHDHVRALIERAHRA